jgi:peptide/nickel transport system permease protein
MRSRLKNISGIKLDRYSGAALFCLTLIFVTGLFSHFIANSKPYMVKYEGKTYFPIVSKKLENQFIRNPGYADWQCIPAERILYSPIPYDAGQSDFPNANYRPPFAKCKIDIPDCSTTGESSLPFRHWLGTNLKGEDLASGLIHGTTVSLKIGVFSILIALFLGTLLGLIAGYFQNDTWKVPLLSFIFMLFSIIPSCYLANLFSFFFEIYGGAKSTGLFMGTLGIYLLSLFLGFLVAYYAGKGLHVIFKWKKRMAVPVDTIVSRLIEIFAAVPKLMLVVALAAILERSVTNVILVIGISSWAGIARLVRAETLKLRNQDFVTSAKALGLKNTRIILHHILPNISGPIIVSFVFGLSAAILIESGLSFLNMGVPEDVVTWGQLLADGKKNFNAWWLIVFPGFAIFITVLCLNILGEKFKSMLDPKNRSFN